MINIAVVEDEEAYAKQLSDYLKQYEKEYDTELRFTRFYDGDEITENYKAEFDIILMDIKMRFMDGMKAAEEIRKLDKNVIIIFITNMTRYAIRGYEVDALDYIVKPIEYFSFSQKLMKAVERVKRKDVRYLAVSVHTGVTKIAIDELRYVESQGHTLRYKTKNGFIESRGVMKDMEEILLSCNFYRSNRGYLVNMKYVDGIKDGCCVIEGEMLPISRAKRQEFMEAFANYLGESVS